MATSEDYKKYFLALASRSVRRVAAELRIADLDPKVPSALICALDGNWWVR